VRASVNSSETSTANSETPVNSAFLTSDPLAEFAIGQEIPGTRVVGQQEIECPTGSARGIEINATTRVTVTKCVKNWTSQTVIVEQKIITESIQAQKIVALAELKTFSLENPGLQKCIDIGSLPQANGENLIGSLCTNPVAGSKKAEIIEVFSKENEDSSPSPIVIPKVLVVPTKTNNVIRIESTSNLLSVAAVKAGEKPVALKMTSNSLGFREVSIPSKLAGYKINVIQNKKVIY
jgi:hypothetical protein